MESNKTRGFEVLKNFDAQLPKRETAKSAGYDLRSVEETFTLNPGEYKGVATGLTAYMQDDEELQIRSRSGLAFKKGIFVLNGPGTIDADYYGKHIMVILANFGTEPFTVEKGDRIAQGVFAKFLTTDDDNATGERTSGLGHTGVK